MLGRGVSPDKGRLEHCTCPSSSNPARVRREQPTGTNSEGLEARTYARGWPRPARFPPWRGHDPSLGPAHPRPCRHTWRGLASTRGSGSRSAWKGGPVTHSRRQVGEGRLPVRSRKRADCSAGGGTQSPRSSDAGFRTTIPISLRAALLGTLGSLRVVGWRPLYKLTADCVLLSEPVQSLSSLYAIKKLGFWKCHE